MTSQTTKTELRAYEIVHRGSGNRLPCACCGDREDQCPCVYLPEGGCETHHRAQCGFCGTSYDYTAYGSCPSCAAKNNKGRVD